MKCVVYIIICNGDAMKIHVKSDGIITATGKFHGKRINAMAKCESSDTFDERFGRDLVCKKYNTKCTYAQLTEHDKKFRQTNREIARLQSIANYEENICNELDKKLQKQIYDCEEYINK